jgi:hypothetical protein
MPNWCLNRLQLTHSDTEALLQIKQIFEGSHGGVFQAIRPVPPSCDLLDDDESRTQAWSVERDIFSPETPENQVRSESIIRVLEAEFSPAGRGYLYAEFDTAWGPPYQILEELRARGFDVTCTYREPSMDFGGAWRNGSDDRYRCRYCKIPKYAGDIAQEICAAIILGRPVMLFRSGKPARLDPESCGVINGSEAVYGVFRGDPIAPDRGDWGLLELKHVDAAFTVHGTKSVAADGLRDGLPRPEFTDTYVTSDAFNNNCEPLRSDEY